MEQSVFNTSAPIFYKKEALSLLRACLAPVLNVKDCNIECVPTTRHDTTRHDVICAFDY